MPAISNLGTGPSNSPISIMFYTLVVSGERFSFTKEQLESDPDNYFTTYFFGSFSGASDSKKELVIEKEPALFRLIQAHLRGYKILPIPDGYVPYMTKDTLVENLLQEAKFYTLANLVKSIKDFQVTSTPILTQPKYKFRSVRVYLHPIRLFDLTKVVPIRSGIIQGQLYILGT